MQTMNRIKAIRGLLFSSMSVLLTLQLVACGASGHEDSAGVQTPKPSRNSVEWCLEQRGADIATSPDDLAFLFEAEANEEVSKSGFAYDKEADVVVEVWSKASFENRPPRWIMWIAHPFGEPQSPEEIVGSHPRRSYVLYVDRPSAATRRKVNSCIDFSTRRSGGQPAVVLHRNDLEEVKP